MKWDAGFVNNFSILLVVFQQLNNETPIRSVFATGLAIEQFIY